MPFVFQGIIGPWYIRHVIAVEEAWPVTPGHFEKGRQHRSKRAGSSLVLRHGTEQALHATLHRRPIELGLVVEDMDDSIHPSIGNAHIRLQSRGVRQAPPQKNPQTDERFGETPLLAPRSRLSAIAVRRSCSLSPSATRGGRPSSVRALRTAPP